MNIIINTIIYNIIYFSSSNKHLPTDNNYEMIIPNVTSLKFDFEAI